MLMNNSFRSFLALSRIFWLKGFQSTGLYACCKRYGELSCWRSLALCESLAIYCDYLSDLIAEHVLKHGFNTIFKVKVEEGHPLQAPCRTTWTALVSASNFSKAILPPSAATAGFTYSSRIDTILASILPSSKLAEGAGASFIGVLVWFCTGNLLGNDCFLVSCHEVSD